MAEKPQTYRIVRFYEHGDRRVTHNSLSLEEAQTHCNNPETSSATATDPYIDDKGHWFDGYEKEA